MNCENLMSKSSFASSTDSAGLEMFTWCIDDDDMVMVGVMIQWWWWWWRWWWWWFLLETFCLVSRLHALFSLRVLCRLVLLSLLWWLFLSCLILSSCCVQSSGFSPLPIPVYRLTTDDLLQAHNFHMWMLLLLLLSRFSRVQLCATP